jgi:hypothetical protein
MLTQARLKAALLSQARAVLAFSPELARQVRNVPR